MLKIDRLSFENKDVFKHREKIEQAEDYIKELKEIHRDPSDKEGPPKEY